MADLLPIGTRVRMREKSRFYNQCKSRGVICDGEITRYSTMSTFDYIVKWDHETKESDGYFHYRNEHIEVIITTNRGAMKLLNKR